VLVVFNVFVSFVIDGLTNENMAASLDGEPNEKLKSFYSMLKAVRAQPLNPKPDNNTSRVCAPGHSRTDITCGAAAAAAAAHAEADGRL
jgi:hypothetical protein